jgi:hypothetical protein
MTATTKEYRQGAIVYMCKNDMKYWVLAKENPQN